MSRPFHFRCELLGPPDLSPATGKVFQIPHDFKDGKPPVVFGNFLANVMLQPIANSSMPFGVVMVAWSQLENKATTEDLVWRLGNVPPEPECEFKREFSSWTFETIKANAIYACGFCLSEAKSNDYLHVSPTMNRDSTLKVLDMFKTVLQCSVQVGDPWAAFLAVGAISSELADRKRDEVMELLSTV
jgi:hypothetical protein